VNGGPSAADLFSAARAQTGNALVTLARRLESPYRWPDLVLPPRTMQQLQEVRAAIRHRTVVLEGWGFAARHGVSRGLNILFAGSSGVGKTMAAQILAHDAELDIYRIDLSSVVSKYIGETERNLERIFVAARASNAVLFFDEADALFGKRSEIKDAHDRYANIEVSYLLQRMEDYDGVAILATNLRRNLDDAFARRLHHVVEFPQPEAADRERLWRAMLPPLAPLARDIDLAFLARQFELTGGHIRNVVLAAAFLAAEEAAPISMRHLMRAVAREIQKLGRMPSRADFREHYDLIREHG
jgi:SpoVK/Ycf46/Vps4 family AAA+-type ATPase